MNITPNVEAYLMMKFDLSGNETLEFDGFYRLLKELQKGDEVLKEIISNAEYG